MIGSHPFKLFPERGFECSNLSFSNSFSQSRGRFFWSQRNSWNIISTSNKLIQGLRTKKQHGETLELKQAIQFGHLPWNMHLNRMISSSTNCLILQEINIPNVLSHIFCSHLPTFEEETPTWAQLLLWLVYQKDPHQCIDLKSTDKEVGSGYSPPPFHQLQRLHTKTKIKKNWERLNIYKFLALLLLQRKKHMTRHFDHFNQTWWVTFKEPG